jgi:hypothetical protein
MKMKKIFALILLIIFSKTYAQEYCGVNFTAYSGQRSVYCKYCDENSTFVVPIKIQFNSTRICNTFKNPNEATAESKCKYNSLKYYISYCYFIGWYSGNSFASKKCYGKNNPNNKHAVYQGVDKEIGLKDYSFEDYELKKYMQLILDIRNYIDLSSYNEGIRISKEYSRLCIIESCQ